MCKYSNAQKYQPYDTNMVWKVFQTGSATAFSNQCYRTDAYNYFVRGYIANNGRLWHKVYANVMQGVFIHSQFGGNCDPSIVPINSTQFIGMFSNDTVNKKVYFVPTSTLVSNFTADDTHLIFDSKNKNIDDTISVFSGGDPSTKILNYKINTIDSILLGTKYHKRFKGATTNTINYSPNIAYFIEGVGASAGVFNSYFYSFSYQSSKLGCFSNTNYTKYYVGQNSFTVALQAYPSALRDTNVCFTTLPSDIISNNLSDQLNGMYPNPVKDKLTLEFDNATSNNLYITNTLGQIVYSVNTVNSKEELDLSFLPIGIYYLKIQNNSTQKVFKVIKE